MKCVFLAETKVWSCGIAPFSRTVEVDSRMENEQKCSSPDYVTCPIALPHLKGDEECLRCPFLDESLKQYCSAAPFTKLIPYNDDLMCRCNVDAHRYCPTFLERAYPKGRRPPTAATQSAGRAQRRAEKDVLFLPERLAYSSNHMWLDIGAEGCCHVGVDEFMARVFGEIDEITFFPKDGVQQVTVVLSIRCMHFPITFPRPMNVTSFNPLLKTNPRTLVEDPYGSGWICEDLEPRSGRPAPQEDRFWGLIHGPDAKSWLRGEIDRMSAFVQQMQIDRSVGAGALMNDGGFFSDGLARHLDDRELVRLYNQFFSLPSMLGGPALRK